MFHSVRALYELIPSNFLLISHTSDHCLKVREFEYVPRTAIYSLSCFAKPDITNNVTEVVARSVTTLVAPLSFALGLVTDQLVPFVLD